MRHDETHVSPTDTWASKGLGLASIGVGLAELLATQQLQRLVGIEGPRTAGILRILGARELMHGVDLLSHHDPSPGLWSRLAGDALDGTLLGLAATKTRNPSGLAKVAAAVLPLVALDVLFTARTSD